MPTEAPIFVLEVQGGHAMPPAIRLKSGRPLESLDIGSRGKWHVTGAGVREVHGHVKFDGATLFVRSESREHPLRVGARPVGDGWEALPVPCRIEIGEAALVFAEAAGGERALGAVGGGRRATRVDELTATRIEPLATSLPSQASPDATILDRSLDSLLAEAAGGASAKEDPSATIFDERPLGALVAPRPLVEAPRPIDIPPTAPPPIQPAASPRRLGLLMRRLSIRPRTALLALTFVLLAIRVISVGHRSAHTSAAPRAAAASSSSAHPAAAAAASEPSNPPDAPRPGVTATGGKTLARLAVDALAAGAYQEAIARYETLRQQYPDRVAYREAARILRAKVAAEPR